MKSALPFLVVAILIFSCSDNGKQNVDNAKPRPRLKDTVFTHPETAVNPYSPIDVSPMDMSYYPDNYQVLKMTNDISTPPLARVIYSRPHLQGRELFHEILTYGQPWRLGANESTELQLFSPAIIERKKVNAGRYVLYCVPEKEKWIIILNSNIDSWGLKPDPSKDLFRFDAPVKETENQLEYFTMIFEKTNDGADLLMAWGDVEARLPMKFSPN